MSSANIKPVLDSIEKVTETITENKSLIVSCFRCLFAFCQNDEDDNKNIELSTKKNHVVKL